jgi:polyhydroxyalkanoate synthase subunit PhaC
MSDKRKVSEKRRVVAEKREKEPGTARRRGSNGAQGQEPILAKAAEAAKRPAQEATQAKAAERQAQEATQAKAAERPAQEATQAKAAERSAQEATQAKAAERQAQEATQAKAAAKPEKQEKRSEGAEQAFPGMQSPDQFVTNMLRAFELSGKVVSKMVEDKDKRNGAFTVAGGMADSGKFFAPIIQHWMADPQGLAATQAKLSQDMVELWGRTYQRFLGQEVEPIIQPAPGDARFNQKEWTENAFFDFMKQAYLLSSKWAETMIENASTVDPRIKHRAQFYLNQVVSALSPSNFPFSNPEVIRTTVSTGAQNLAQGMTQLLEDLNQSGELLRIRQTDMSAFEVGKNLAVTPGKVVYQNDIMQLIQYTPTTESVYDIPLLIVPPWINKFYILDLTPPKSFIKWVVDQGFTVFVISWVNPRAELGSKTFEDYMREGVLEAVDKTLLATGAPQTHTLGYCVGGTMLSCALAYMAATGDERIRSATFFTAQNDFTKAGDLLVFIDDEQLKALDEVMFKAGYLDGARMSTVFNALRPKDLVWPYIVNNYLLGKQPFPFDLLFWNSDSTRMPPANHSFYLREFYLENKLAKGLLKLGGVTLDLSRVTIPVYELAAKEDHIAPAQSVLFGAKLFGGPVRFVLAGSGHIAGVINPPYKPKYMHWIMEDGDPKVLPSVEAFLAKAKERPGSWWPDLAKWLASLSGKEVTARAPGSGVLTPIEDAPGSYVRS